MISIEVKMAQSKVAKYSGRGLDLKIRAALLNYCSVILLLDDTFF